MGKGEDWNHSTGALGSEHLAYAPVKMRLSRLRLTGKEWFVSVGSLSFCLTHLRTTLSRIILYPTYHLIIRIIVYVCLLEYINNSSTVLIDLLSSWALLLFLARRTLLWGISLLNLSAMKFLELGNGKLSGSFTGCSISLECYYNMLIYRQCPKVHILCAVFLSSLLCNSGES